MTFHPAKIAPAPRAAVLICPMTGIDRQAGMNKLMDQYRQNRTRLSLIGADDDLHIIGRT
jgi:hypothetical protein